MDSGCTKSRRRRQGICLALIALLLPIVILLCAFSVNVAQMQLARTELQAATDASARAAGRIFAEHQDATMALAVANQIGEQNLVSGKPLEFVPEDIELGVSTRCDISSPYLFTPANSGHNALRLNGRRTAGSPSGPVDYLFPLFTQSSFETSIQSVSTQVELDIAIVLDRSGSMAYADREPAVYPPVPAAANPDWFFGDPAPEDARWFDAVNATSAFLNALDASPQSEHVSLVTYADSASIDVALTSNYSEVMAGLDVFTQALEGGGTNIASGIYQGSSSLANAAARPFASRVIVIMTDGNYNLGSNPKYAARTVAGSGTMVFTVTFSEEAGQWAMMETAREGGGKHFHATSGADLVAVFEEIAHSLPTLITQ
jgi:hypothetical protein